MPEEHLRQLAINLRETREAAGYSQVLLAQRSGVDLKHINRIELGKRDPSTHTLLRLARALSTTPADLLRNIK
jgi:transcriptional regulator with XRE-family HTH domain